MAVGLKKRPDDFSRIKLTQGVALGQFAGEIPTRPVMAPAFYQVKKNLRMAGAVPP